MTIYIPVAEGWERRRAFTYFRFPGLPDRFRRVGWHEYDDIGWTPQSYDCKLIDDATVACCPAEGRLTVITVSGGHKWLGAWTMWFYWETDDLPLVLEHIMGCSILRVYAAAWNGKRKSLMLRFMGSTGSDTWTSRRVALVADADGVRPYTAEDLQALKECETV